MKIIVNGKVMECFLDTYHDLISSLNLNPEHIVIECNAQILQKDDWNKKMQENDELEIVSFVGGG